MKPIKNLFTHTLGIIVVLEVLAFVAFLCLLEVPVNNQRLLDVTLGTLLGAFNLIIGYYFGSSKGSADKTELLANRPEKPAASPGPPTVSPLLAGCFLALGLLGLAGCGTMDQAYLAQVTMTNVARVEWRTNTVILFTNATEVIERTNTIFVTNAAGMAEPKAVLQTFTNYAPVFLTNFVAVPFTNLVAVPVTNLVARPEVETGIKATGTIVDTFAPGLGGLVGAALMGAYHIYQAGRNKKTNGALVQGIETARSILAATPQGEAADAEFVRWLKNNQKAVGVWKAIAPLVELVDNDAAKEAASLIQERVAKSQATSLPVTAAPAPAPPPPKA